MTFGSRVARDLVTPQSRLPRYIINASSYRYNLITSTAYYYSYMSTLSLSYHMYQPCHSYTYGTSSPNRLETRVAMMPADQTNEACRLNVNRDLGSVQSISMVTTQLFVDCKKTVKCQLIYSVFRIATKPSSARG